MTRLNLPHRVDVYMLDGSGLTLARGNLSGYFEPATAGGRVGLQDVAESAIACLWLELEAQSVIADGMQIFWRNRGTWWTAKGAPAVFDVPGCAHIEVTAAANALDGFFRQASPHLPLSAVFSDAGQITAVKLEVADSANFGTIVLTAFSTTSAAGWLYSNGGVWMAVPSGGFPSLSTQMVAYVPPSALPSGSNFVRWTPYAGSTALTAKMIVAAMGASVAS